MLDERRLQRMQAAVVRQAFDRGDLAALVLHGQRQAGVIRSPSTSTVQAPQAPWSQPFLVPVR